MKEELHISDRRLALIRRLIYLAYTCTDKELFYKKFMKTVNIDSLKDSELVKISDYALQIPDDKNLSDEEIEILCLMQQGFAPQEIAVIYREKSVNAVYIKQHRIKRKLKGAATPEIVWVMLVLCLVVCFFMAILDVSGI